MNRLNYLLLLLLAPLAMETHAQRFKPNAMGHVDDPAFLQFIKERQYQLVSDFLQEKNLTIPYAEAMKAGEWIFIDANGTEYAHKSDVRDALRKPVKEDDSNEEIWTVNEGFSAEAYYGGPHTFQQAGRTGLKVGEKIVIPAQFDDVSSIWNSNGTYYKVLEDGSSGIWNNEGKEIIPPVYGEISYDDQYRRFTCRGHGYDSTWFCNEAGGMLFGRGFTHTESFNGQLYMVSTGKQDHYGLANIVTGEFVLPCIYQRIGHGYERTAYREISIPDTSPEQIAKYVRQWPGVDPELYGVIDTLGKIIIPVQYERVWIRERSGYVIVQEKSGYGVVGLNGTTILPSTYEKLVSLDGDERSLLPAKLLAFKENGKAGIMTVDKKVLVKPYYDELYPAYNGVIAYEGKQCGMITIDGKLLLPFQDLEISHVRHGIVRGRRSDRQWCLLDFYGNTHYEKR